ncbi:tumor necrosis factor ligand superfamily member 11 [Elysia marginata]|uniref:Tumor necrosis factor ligand superfamily member 11 n=1 Tax=Elysia marginata TaxID=1093978 RepID=A0AAV4IQM3_9GAST|nr:tumor necrosis factor ligand superfamily member 11 [Elysia marginata]
MMARPNPNSVKHEHGRQQTIKKWHYRGDMAFLAGGAEYDAGRIVVPLDGYYFVYCHISFADYLHKNSDTGSSSLAVYLYRYNILYDKGGEENLARQSISKCDSRNKNLAEYVISIGAVFYLRRQDHILIKVSNITTVDTTPKSSYFGFFKI